MSTLLPVLIALAALWLVWRFVASLFRPGRPAEAVDAEPVDGPFAPVPAPRRNFPKGKPGAVALDEPEDDSFRAFPPRC